ncbi:TetR/AcrR family transcriptional regulator [Microbacterium sp. zg.B48]|uniref:TetR/AcrR family transcriptional regulator n=1 Tax=unclassified Microbacterium TaxID=2609290 RepID=UPI00214CA949|nr:MULTISPECIES: TetR/AcrR family transcriptional regulator [unclassified Microbacterium]MCR2763616.1 TetR/AcrR family transcriptional regulator [Microbacterium sp. zg.B48]MCR2809337.1 TetR/AcrR family transcriptional regulator [Microbacterium sp. zg.B185]WIM20477.1 TetR/AcrR family transcriptional regulator [Microbacterium sp. zg-B185]
MPKISAPTVAEHRRRQREALLTAATDLLVRGGVSAVTPAAVGAAAGLARPSVYQYFDSTAGILAAIIEDSFPRANARLAVALDGLVEPLEVMDAYVRETLRQAAEGAHRPAAALSGAELPEQCRARLSELHREQVAPFMDALQRLGVPDLMITARLLGGVLESAMGAIESGAEPEAVTRATIALIHAAVQPPGPAPA